MINITFYLRQDANGDIKIDTNPNTVKRTDVESKIFVEDASIKTALVSYLSIYHLKKFRLSETVIVNPKMQLHTIIKEMYVV